MKLKGMEKAIGCQAFRMGPDTALVVSISEYRDEMRLDVRKFWRPYARDGGDPDEFVPTKKGVNIPEDLIPDFLAAVVNAVGDFNEDLLDDIR